MPIIVLIALLILIATLWAARSRYRRRRRDALLQRPLAASRAAILARNLPLFRRLPDAIRRTLGGLVNVFLDDKRFEGCDGLEVTEEMRVTVAGHACLLLLGGGRPVFPGFRSILMYPHAFVTEQTEYDGWVETREHSVRSGESWQRGPVILSWSQIREELEHPGDGRDVIVHEFAHKLDEEHGHADGLPRLSDPAQYSEWHAVLSREYAALRRDTEAGRPTVLDAYGGESPAEFFAVASEAFFGMPEILCRNLPELYQQLQRYYRLDPASDYADEPGGAGTGERDG